MAEDETGDPSFDAIMDEIREAVEGNARQQQSKTDAFWDSLTVEQRISAFQAVTQRLHAAWKEGRSYRGTLYDVFGFPPHSYSVGMDSGYFWMHNALPEHDSELPPKAVERIVKGIQEDLEGESKA